jgi:hypothetical protein
MEKATGADRAWVGYSRLRSARSSRVSVSSIIAVNPSRTFTTVNGASLQLV